MLAALKQYILDSELPYQVTRYFTHGTTLLDPIHLYGSWFSRTITPSNDKIAGYKTYSTFNSPRFRTTPDPLAC